MKEEQASQTAVYMALFRALESAQPASRRLFEDPLAASFLPTRLRMVAGLSRASVGHSLICSYIDRRWPGVRTSAIARTRFIDDAAEEALRSGIEQVVILGAGFDARAYRIGAMARGVVFEVDHPSTSAAKQRGVAKLLGGAPAHVRFVPVDFNAERFEHKMESVGCDPLRRTLLIWEGVTNYLTEEAVNRTLRWCAGFPTGSRVVFTYVHRQVLHAPWTFHGTARLFATLRAASETWTFGIEPSSLPEFLQLSGLQLDEDIGASDYRVRYFGRAAERMRGYEFYRVVLAHVR